MGEARLSSLTIMYIKYKQSGAGELGGGGLKLLLRDTLQHTSNFVKRFVYLAGMYHYVWMLQVKRKYCCHDQKYLLS